MMTEKTTACLIDLDGTLCDSRHRHHLIVESDPSDTDTWERHSLACVDDPPIRSTIELVKMLAREHHIVICSGRTDVATIETREWLRAHGVPWNRIVLRKPGDTTSNGNFKIRAIKEIEEQEGWRFVLALDDYHKTVTALNDYGVPCIQVASYTGDNEALAPSGWA